MGVLRSIQPSPLSDKDLLTLYQNEGKQEILAQLFLRYTDLVYGTCAKYLGNQEAAKDAVMNIYEELLQKVQLHKIDNFKSWLYVVAKNHCLMQIRQGKKMVTTEFDGQIVQAEDFSHLDGVLEKERQLNKLSGCMEQLGEEQRRTVQLFYLENKCYHEITLITGFDWNKVRSLVQNGRRNLKICMESNGGNPHI
ncbi:MAG: sigma-70 family RNA polymerase sigma factor [Williamsia sp.]|nr:sigma-70 family RNA polymerase sigma factor [Williamsia sp.]